MNKRFAYRFLQPAPDGSEKFLTAYGSFNLDNVIDVKSHLVLENGETEDEKIPAIHVYVYLSGTSTQEYQKLTNPVTGIEESVLVNVPYFVRLTHPQDVEEFLGIASKNERSQGFFGIFKSNPVKYLRSWIQGLLMGATPQPEVAPDSGLIVKPEETTEETE